MCRYGSLRPARPIVEYFLSHLAPPVQSWHPSPSVNHKAGGYSPDLPKTCRQNQTIHQLTLQVSGRHVAIHVFLPYMRILVKSYNWYSKRCARYFKILRLISLYDINILFSSMKKCLQQISIHLVKTGLADNATKHICGTAENTSSIYYHIIHNMYPFGDEIFNYSYRFYNTDNDNLVW